VFPPGISNMSPWKECDIRGRFPEEVSPELFRGVGLAAASLLAPKARVIVAGDFRQSTLELKTALIEALVQGGSHVLDAGQIPTPIAYFAHRALRSDAVFIVTASHNPPDHNGLKLMLGCLPPDAALFAQLRNPTKSRSSRCEGEVEVVDVVPEYRSRILNRWRHLASESRCSLVVDAGNGSWSDLAPRIMIDLGLHVHPLFCEVDARFPNRSADSARISNLTVLCRQVKATRSQLGIAWDGDGDRVAFVDRHGRAATADEVSMLLARYLLSGNPGARVAYDLKLSDRVREVIEAATGKPIMERSGHAFLKRRMIKEDCLLGCEASGHYFHRELGGGDDGLYTALLMIEMTARLGPLDEMVRSLPELFVTPDLRLPLTVVSFESVAERLSKGLRVLRTSTLDGIKFITADGTVLVRRSITEPTMTLRIDACEQRALDRLLEACLSSVPEIEHEIRAQFEHSRFA
jgi:phosphomannomutase